MALDNLDKYFVVAGITERYNESLLVLKNELQWNSPFYSIANKSKKGIRRDFFPDPFFFRLRSV